MALADLTDWVDTFGQAGAVWYAKRLSANDTLATGAHQAGPYIPKELLFDLFPQLKLPQLENPRVNFQLYIDSHISEFSDRQVTAIWYNNRLRGGTRNESRLTGFGGIASALLDPENTGALAVFAFYQPKDQGSIECHVWVCDDEVQSDLFEERLGPVEPGSYVIWRPGIHPAQTDLFGTAAVVHGSCWLTSDKLPPDWLIKFPSGWDIVNKVIDLRPATGTEVDKRLLRRRDCEFEMFKSVEQEFYKERISGGFTTMNEFISLANTVLQSRKSRSGKSLEYHTITILREEGFVQDMDFAWNPDIDGKRPDFLFPSKEAYFDAQFKRENLAMLAAKTTCKDRWRQIRNEVDRDKVPELHLLTLQEGVSANQFNEMKAEGIQLVVPLGLHRSYPDGVRDQLLSVDNFLTLLREKRHRH